MSTATQRPNHYEHTSAPPASPYFGGLAGDQFLCEDPRVFLYQDYQDMVYGLDASRLVRCYTSCPMLISLLMFVKLKTWHMIPNLLFEALGADGARELINVILKQHDAEQGLRRVSGSIWKRPESSSSHPEEMRKNYQVEVVRRMIERAETELELLKKAEVTMLN